jgi:hypothetical protein
MQFRVTIVAVLPQVSIIIVMPEERGMLPVQATARPEPRCPWARVAIIFSGWLPSMAMDIAAYTRAGRIETSVTRAVAVRRFPFSRG